MMTVGTVVDFKVPQLWKDHYDLSGELYSDVFDKLYTYTKDGNIYARTRISAVRSSVPETLTKVAPSDSLKYTLMNIPGEWSESYLTLIRSVRNKLFDYSGYSCINIGDKVRIKEWSDLESEFELSENGDIYISDKTIFPKSVKCLCGKVFWVHTIRYTQSSGTLCLLFDENDKKTVKPIEVLVRA